MSSQHTPDRVDAATVRGWLAEPDAVTVIDVRSPAEFDTAHIRGSCNVPLNLLGEHATQLAARLHRDVVLVCQSGVRAAQAQQHLAGVGADRVHVLDGGIGAYSALGGEVVRGRARWALERQVRLVAGVLVLAGLVIGLRFPAARWLTAGIGAGLTISALTNTCTMARILSLLPYNRGTRNPTPEEVLNQFPAPQQSA